MSYFQVNEKCNGCLACVQNCPARALEAREAGGLQTLLHNMARCARCATCWRICPQGAVEFRHMLENRWDEVVTHVLVRCQVCGEVVYTEPLTRSLDEKVRQLVEPLCARHKLERQAAILSGRVPVAGGGVE
ncbi:MAG: 4Fe-4S dicluster domain-containing protein [Acidobacteria bacterium]|nr:4Fe-4S dicluster domain-containing protein [Acidobacteriota bacterium]